MLLLVLALCFMFMFFFFLCLPMASGGKRRRPLGRCSGRHAAFASPLQRRRSSALGLSLPGTRHRPPVAMLSLGPPTTAAGAPTEPVGQRLREPLAVHSGRRARQAAPLEADDLQAVSMSKPTPARFTTLGWTRPPGSSRSSRRRATWLERMLGSTTAGTLTRGGLADPSKELFGARHGCEGQRPRLLVNSVHSCMHELWDERFAAASVVASSYAQRWRS